MKLVRRIVLYRFPTHIKISESRRAKVVNGVTKNPKAAGTPGYQKITFQGLYSGNIHPFTRNKIVEGMHKYINYQLRKEKPIDIDPEKPLVIRGKLYVPRNYGKVSVRNGNLTWKPPKETYVEEWDVLNASVFWIKAFEDCISRPDNDANGVAIRESLIPDDNASFISGSGEMRRRYIDSLAKRKIVFEIYEDDLK
ncbi:MAG: hypothetical protein ACXAAM_05565 [Candidatus Heimdallarchaeaceae archaeon]